MAHSLSTLLTTLLATNPVTPDLQPAEVTTAQVVETTNSGGHSPTGDSGVRLTLDDELLLPDEFPDQVTQRVTDRLLEHDLDPAAFSLRIGWHDRNTIQHGIWLDGPDFQTNETCSACSKDALFEKALSLVDQAVAAHEARKRVPAPSSIVVQELPPPSPVAPPPPPRDRYWPIRRGFAATLTAIAGATVITGVALIVAKEHEIRVEMYNQGSIRYYHDLREPGYVVLGVGAGALVGGAAWLVVEQTRRRKSLGKDAQSRIEPGIGSMTIRF